MIFLCAQPDEPYFEWQLEVQLFNFKRMGIDPSKIHQVFVSQRPITERLIKYIERHPEINVHFYPDTRKSKGYIPSMRPNAIKQFFAEFPEMERERIFYHDADIIFKSLPDFEKLCEGDTWWVSDTNSYLNADYIKSKGEGLLEEMCQVVGISAKVVEAQNNASGGAQYIISGTNEGWWNKVERDCEALYEYTNSSIPKWAAKWAEQTGNPASSYHSLQGWTADMWCVLWNGLLLGKKVSLSPELNFSWATGSIQDYYSCHIFHNAGVTDGDKHRLFFKGEYIHKSPFGVDFSYVDANSGSIMYVKEIMETAKQL